uniref:Protein kinase domain-containing protein n=1 Tax=viral metagenome TaxID=1070528 RepID=A0A6C0JST6_9ZZZZ
MSSILLQLTLKDRMEYCATLKRCTYPMIDKKTFPAYIHKLECSPILGEYNKHVCDFFKSQLYFKVTPLITPNSIYSMTADALTKFRCPNFLFPFYSFVYDITDENILCNEYFFTKPCQMTLYELYEGYLTDSALSHIIKLKDDEIFTSIMSQILMAIHCLQHNYLMNHNNICAENILLSFCYRPDERLKTEKDNKDEFWEYIVYDEKYYVKNTGIIVHLANFEHAVSYHPRYSQHLLGERNFFLNSKSKLYPFQTAYKLDDCGCLCPNNLFYIFTDNDGKDIETTRNIFKLGSDHHMVNLCTYKGKDRNFVVDEFNLECEAFPPMEFSFDIQDFINMILGGEKSIMPGSHSKWNIPESWIPILTEYKNHKKGYWNRIWVSGNAHLLLAGLLIRQIGKENNLLSRYHVEGKNLEQFKSSRKILETYTVSKRLDVVDVKDVKEETGEQMKGVGKIMADAGGSNKVKNNPNYNGNLYMSLNC